MQQQVGHATLRLPAYDESYTITLPSLHIEGLMSGAPYVELEKSSYIVSTSGYISRIDYSGRGWLSGKKNTFSATLAKKDAPKDVL
jgi:oxysterol-binding protein-related protein 9/10/11